MKLAIFLILFVLITIPSVLAHPVITHTHPTSITSMTPEPVKTNEFQREFFTVLISVIVGTMTVTVLIVYREDIPVLKKL